MFNYTDYLPVYSSSNVDEVWYNRDTEELVVKFFENPRGYGYREVPISLYEKLVSAESDPMGSVGRTYTSDIKGAKPGFDAGDETAMYRRINAGVRQAVAQTVPTQTYVVSYTEPGVATVEATSLQEAIDKVVDGNEDVKITSVTVTFA